MSLEENISNLGEDISQTFVLLSRCDMVLQDFDGESEGVKPRKEPKSNTMLDKLQALLEDMDTVIDYLERMEVRLLKNLKHDKQIG